MSREEYIKHCRRQIVEQARDMLAGKLGFIEGVRSIKGFCRDAGLTDDDPDYTSFVAIDSETDSLPMGETRNLWNPAALANLQPQIDEAEQWAKKIGSKACENLIARFEKNLNDVIEDYGLHDATLLAITVDWEEARATIDLRTSNGPQKIIATGLKNLHLPRAEEWGRSVSILYVVRPEDVSDSPLTIGIQMQSGDLIELTADAFDGHVTPE